ncbi:MAG: hypothetical protein ACI4LB_03995 [Candidatus Fimenecus sp.]
MSQTQTKVFLSAVFKIFVLCLAWSFSMKKADGFNAICAFVWKPFVLYLPLALITIGILIGCVADFLDDHIQKRIQKLSAIVIAFAIIVFMAMIFLLGKSNLKDINRQKNIASMDKYQVEHFAVTPELIEDTEISAEGSNYFAFQNSFCFYTNQRYVCAEEKKFDLELSAYELENIPRFCFQKMDRLLTEQYFERHFRYLGVTCKQISGEQNGKEYIYANYERNDKATKYNYFVILVKNENQISLLALETYYIDHYSIDIPSIIEKMTKNTGDGSLCD